MAAMCCRYKWTDPKTKKEYYKFACNEDGKKCADSITDKKKRKWTLDAHDTAPDCDLCWPVPEAPKKG
jgi:hypothetical protein